MITPKVQRPTRADEADAYELATIRDRDTCQRCRARCGPSNRDHRKNRSQGGWTVASNLQILGGTGTTGCNGWATSHPALAVAEGWACPSWAEPAEWPARRAVDGALVWVLYDDAGGIRVITDAEADRRMNADGTVF